MVKNFKETLKLLQIETEIESESTSTHAKHKASVDGIFNEKFYLLSVIIVSVVWVIFAFIYFYLEYYRVAFLEFAIAAVTVISYFILLKTKSFNIAGSFVLFCSFFFECARVYFSGGYEYASFYTWTTVPLFGGILLTPGVNVFWSLLFLLIPIFYFIIHSTGIVIPNYTLHKDHEAFDLISILFVNIGVLVAVTYFKKLIDYFMNLVQKQKNEKTALVRVMTHDISNPLLILNFAVKQQIKKCGETPELLKIKKASTSIEMILSNIRLLEGVSSGKLQLVFEDLHPYEALMESVQFIKDTAESKNISIQIECSEMLKTAMIKAEKSGLIFQIFNNILTNAIKFSPVNSEIKVQFLNPEPKIIEIRFVDHGIGIPDNIKDHIFNFDGEQTSRLGTDGEKGTGFGLPIVKFFVEKFKGTIHFTSVSQVEDPVSQDTTFILKFPLAN